MTRRSSGPASHEFSRPRTASRSSPSVPTAGKAVEELSAGCGHDGRPDAGSDGIAATAHRGLHEGPLDVLVLTTFGEDEVLWGAIEAGAAGFVLEDSSAEDLIAAVRAVAGGGAWFDPGVAPRLLDRYRQLVAPAARDAARLDELTHREHDVLRLMAHAVRPSPRSRQPCSSPGHRQDPRQQHLRQARRARPRRRDRVRVRPRRGHARQRVDVAVRLLLWGECNSNRGPMPSGSSRSTVGA